MRKRISIWKMVKKWAASSKHRFLTRGLILDSSIGKNEPTRRPRMHRLKKGVLIAFEGIDGQEKARRHDYYRATN